MALSEDATYCDCTAGGGGHLAAMLESTRTARFIGIDCDPDAISHCRQRLASFADRCTLVEDNFINLDLILGRLNVESLNGVLFDLGVSYHQVTTAERGFSFDRDGRLLMTMSPSSMPLHERLRHARRQEIITVLKEYGDVRGYRRLGDLIYEHRSSLGSTMDLRRLIERSVPRRFLKKNLHKVFQAFRIWTNDELGNLSQGLTVALRRLCAEGRMLAIAYHSGEDRIVKRFCRQADKDGTALLLRRKAVKPNDTEVEVNPSARSAKLRIIKKCAS